MTDSANDAGPSLSRRVFAAAPIAAGAAGLFGASQEASAAGAVKLSAGDRLEIMELLSRYAWAYDCNDPEAAAAAFTPDGSIEAFGQITKGREAIVKLIESVYEIRGDKIWTHLIDHYVFQPTKEGCRVFCYWTQVEKIAPNENGNIRATGYYVTDCVQHDGAWLIERRAIVPWDGSKLPW
ncbi:SgcJ/EcaC family oxidoreductase [Hyphococcus luteus]|uniref:SnoaL-like domain-containing protein n=1 Tax=Hyphococcus luteus TaxID=2058213 RepID=A0A2S7K540_9PROT|nr:SgcJ/EcaC family oxidoreductase [Marinicaulis flavus]PQA87620.1 hypothetical protein CW354_11120 [Marinicaulis flavus]